MKIERQWKGTQHRLVVRNPDGQAQVGPWTGFTQLATLRLNKSEYLFAVADAPGIRSAFPAPGRVYLAQDMGELRDTEAAGT